MYAVIESGGKQYKVEVGNVVSVEKLDKNVGDTVEFDVLLTGDESNITVGDPIVKGASVKGEVLEHGKAKKVIILAYKAKKDYRKRQGHRQPYTRVKITEIK